MTLRQVFWTCSRLFVSSSVKLECQTTETLALRLFNFCIFVWYTLFVIKKALKKCNNPRRCLIRRDCILTIRATYSSWAEVETEPIHMNRQIRRGQMKEVLLCCDSPSVPLFLCLPLPTSCWGRGEESRASLPHWRNVSHVLRKVSLCLHTG